MSTWIAATQERPLFQRGRRDLRGERLIETRSAGIAGSPCGSVDAALRAQAPLFAAGAGKQRGYLPVRSSAVLPAWSCFVGHCVVANRLIAKQLVANQDRGGTAGREVRGM